MWYPLLFVLPIYRDAPSFSSTNILPMDLIPDAPDSSNASKPNSKHSHYSSHYDVEIFSSPVHESQSSSASTSAPLSLDPMPSQSTEMSSPINLKRHNGHVVVDPSNEASIQYAVSIIQFVCPLLNTLMLAAKVFYPRPG
jgi:hypothetical protein